MRDKATISNTQRFHLHPRDELVMKLPQTGPRRGPRNAAPVNKSTPIPRLTGDCQISDMAPPTTASAEDPNNPLKNRQMMIVCTFRARAIGIEKSAKSNVPIISGYFLPTRSDKGPIIRGPTVKP